MLRRFALSHCCGTTAATAKRFCATKKASKQTARIKFMFRAASFLSLGGKTVKISHQTADEITINVGDEVQLAPGCTATQLYWLPLGFEMVLQGWLKFPVTVPFSSGERVVCNCVLYLTTTAPATATPTATAPTTTVTHNTTTATGAPTTTGPTSTAPTVTHHTLKVSVAWHARFLYAFFGISAAFAYWFWKYPTQDLALPEGFVHDQAQADAFDAIIRKRIKQPKTHVLTGFRGTGKSTVAKERVLRWNGFWSVLKEGLRLCYIDAKDAATHAEFVKKIEAAKEDVALPTSWEIWQFFIIPFFLVAPQVKYFAGAFWCTSHLIYSRLHQTVIYVVDDISDSSKTADQSSKMSFAELQSRLHHVDTKLTPILISSNEGIEYAFRDTAPKVRVLGLKLPSMGDATLAKILQTDFPKLTDAEAKDVVDTADAYLPEHWARSGRFYALVSSNKDELVGVFKALKDDDGGDKELKKRLSTKALIGIVDRLDLQTNDVCRALALGLSPPLTNDERKRMINFVHRCAQLQRGKTRADLEKALPENCPRRLALVRLLSVADTNLVERYGATGKLREAEPDSTYPINFAVAFMDKIEPVLKLYPKGGKC